MADKTARSWGNVLNIDEILDIVLDDNDYKDNDMGLSESDKGFVMSDSDLEFEMESETLKIETFVKDNNLQLLTESIPSTLLQLLKILKLQIQFCKLLIKVVLIAMLSPVMYPLTCICLTLNQLPQTHSRIAMKTINNLKVGKLKMTVIHLIPQQNTGEEWGELELDEAVSRGECVKTRGGRGNDQTGP